MQPNRTQAIGELLKAVGTLIFMIPVVVFLGLVVFAVFKAMAT